MGKNPRSPPRCALESCEYLACELGEVLPRLGRLEGGFRAAAQCGPCLDVGLGGHQHQDMAGAHRLALLEAPRVLLVERRDVGRLHENLLIHFLVEQLAHQQIGARVFTQLRLGDLLRLQRRLEVGLGAHLLFERGDAGVHVRVGDRQGALLDLLLQQAVGDQIVEHATIHLGALLGGNRATGPLFDGAHRAFELGLRNLVAVAVGDDLGQHRRNRLGRRSGRLGAGGRRRSGRGRRGRRLLTRDRYGRQNERTDKLAHSECIPCVERYGGYSSSRPERPVRAAGGKIVELARHTGSGVFVFVVAEGAVDAVVRLSTDWTAGALLVLPIERRLALALGRRIGAEVAFA